MLGCIFCSPLSQPSKNEKYLCAILFKQNLHIQGNIQSTRELMSHLAVFSRLNSKGELCLLFLDCLTWLNVLFFLRAVCAAHASTSDSCTSNSILPTTCSQAGFLKLIFIYFGICIVCIVIMSWGGGFLYGSKETFS